MKSKKNEDSRFEGEQAIRSLAIAISNFGD